MTGRRWANLVVAVVAAAAMGLPAPASEASPTPAPPGCASFGLPIQTGPEPLESKRSFLSSDGRFVVFMSNHPLVPDDTNTVGDVFRYDRATGEVLRLNLEKTGGELRHGGLPTSVSDDADRVLFLTGSPELVGDGFENQAYVRRITAGKTELVSANLDGKPSNGPVDQDADISADGRWVAFSSQSTDLVASDPRPRDRFAHGSEVYLRDLDADTTIPVTTPFGTFRSGTHSFSAAVSGDGRFVAFSSNAGWTSDDTHAGSDAFVWDRQTKRYELVGVDPSGRAMGGSVHAMSDDGNLVVFGALDRDGDGGAVYVRDRAARTTRWLASHPRSSSSSVSMSGDGTVVAIQTLDAIEGADTNGRDDLLLVDPSSGAVLPVRAADFGCAPDTGVFAPELSGDGSLVVVESAWDHIDPRDRREIFLFDVAAGDWTQITPHVIETRPPGTGPLPGTPPWPDQPPVDGDPDDEPPADPGTGLTSSRLPTRVGGYWMLTAAGTVQAFGEAAHFGHAELGAADIEPTPDMDGYWVLHIDGLVTGHGAAPEFGDAELEPDELAMTLSATPSGGGYWVFTTNGRVIPFGDAPFFGDMSGVTLNGPVLDSVATPTGRGYFMVAADGGIFAFGDARFAGSMGGKRINRPVVAMAPDPDGFGYWLVSEDGGIFAFQAPFFGSMGHVRLNEPVTGTVPGALGYLMVAADGGIFAFGDIPFHGSLGAKPPADPVVAVALRRT